MKKKVTAIALIVACLAILGYVTYAYFSDQAEAVSAITAGDLDITLLEWANEDKTIPFPDNPISGVMPGQDVTKIVEIRNTGTQPAFIRVSVDKTINLVGGGMPDLSLVKLDFDQIGWTYWEGYYYYNQILQPGETTTALFANVTFDRTMNNDYQNCTVIVDVHAYATQAAHNGDNPLTAKGWPTEEMGRNK